MNPKYVRADDTSSQQQWKLRVTPISIRILFTLVGALLTMGIVRVIPGGVVVGSIADVQRLAGHVARLDTVVAISHAQFTVTDSLHSRRLDRIERDVRLLTDNAMANTRKECATMGLARAKAYGYPCDEVGFHLPQGVP